MTLNNDEVICPNCVHQFRAIPQNVQQLMLDAGFGPPFTTPPAQRTWVGLTDEKTEHLWEISRAAMPRYHTFKTLIEKALRERNT